MPKASIRIAAIMASYNRRETTLRCLTSLAAQRSDQIHITTFLLDDASPDRTGDAVRSRFPDVHVLKGDGQRFWGGGMHLAMQAAEATDYDFMLWLNDDVVLKCGALAKLVATCREVDPDGSGLQAIIGAMEDPSTGTVSYAAFNRLDRWRPDRLKRVEPVSNRAIMCDTFNGNCVLLPSKLVRRLGPVDPVFKHQLGDIDYGYRVWREGGGVWLAPEAAGLCAPNERPKRWLNRSASLAARVRTLLGPFGLPPRAWLTFMWRHGGVVAIASLPGIYAKALLQHH